MEKQWDLFQLHIENSKLALSNSLNLIMFLLGRSSCKLSQRRWYVCMYIGVVCTYFVVCRVFTVFGCVVRCPSFLSGVAMRPFWYLYNIYELLSSSLFRSFVLFPFFLLGAYGDLDNLYLHLAVGKEASTS